ncbi:MAG: 4-hydroxythreonine-4-phosphate dehydrogenase PdxA [Prevotellaceae bacterium]|jgi:4-hydroxythreonine-4-phosphate dehydrogenase|nr:4-hydroxythreonine-4-phosphate dehydrogenase PdxA [Prevotellaceae bacterium]
MKDGKIIVGITHGDINGISYEVMLKTFEDNRIIDFCTPVIYGSTKIWGFYRNLLKIENINLNLIMSSKDARSKCINFINVMNDNAHAEVGHSTQMAGEGALKALQAAARDIREKKIDVMVTAPINKYNVQIPGKKFIGHTEFLADDAGVQNYLMLMVNDNLKIGVITGHIPLKDVSKSISTKLILQKIDILNESLKKDFLMVKPRIAVLGLNPHCGDNGLIGTEEKEIILPAIKEAQGKNILVFGPYSADGFLSSETSKKFDGILAMYHDQGMIAFKSRAFDTGVNYTAGLPFVRTSPAHGTAYEISGQGTANADSFRTALYMACDIFKNRNRYNEMNAHSLKIDISATHKHNDHDDATIIANDDYSA